MPADHTEKAFEAAIGGKSGHYSLLQRNGVTSP